MKSNLKRSVSNIAGVGIIYRAWNPRELFIEVKDDGHPIKLVRRQLCFIGGNWIGKNALVDQNPYATFLREACDEELSFDRPIRDAADLENLGMSLAQQFAPTPMNDVSVDLDDEKRLARLKDVVRNGARPYGDWINTVSKEALDTADPQNTRAGFASLGSYYHVGLDERTWSDIRQLQEKFGNISNESITLITSLDEILRTSTKTSFGHDRVLQHFWLKHGFSEAANLPLVLGITSEYMGMPLSSYAEYLERYEVMKMPS